MFDSVIKSGAVVDRAILDKEVVVGQGATVGEGPDLDTPNREEPGRLNTGITVVGKRTVIPRSTRIGRNVRIGGDVRASDFRNRVIKSGSSVNGPRTDSRLREAQGAAAVPGVVSSTNSAPAVAGASRR
jgi:glucose-1-phosphate adenylyltransferase